MSRSRPVQALSTLDSSAQKALCLLVSHLLGSTQGVHGHTELEEERAQLRNTVRHLSWNVWGRWFLSCSPGANQTIHYVKNRQKYFQTFTHDESLPLKYFSEEEMWRCAPANKAVKQEKAVGSERDWIKPQGAGTESSTVLAMQGAWRGMRPRCSRRTGPQKRGIYTLNTVFVIMDECKAMTKDRQSKSFRSASVWGVIGPHRAVHIRNASQSLSHSDSHPGVKLKLNQSQKMHTKLIFQVLKTPNFKHFNFQFS